MLGKVGEMPWLFAKALWKHWWALMSSAVFTFLGIYVAARQLGNDWVMHASFLVVLKFGQEAVRPETASYGIAVEFSNYGSDRTWRTDYQLECDFVDKQIRVKPGGCTLISSEDSSD